MATTSPSVGRPLSLPGTSGLLARSSASSSLSLLANGTPARSPDPSLLSSAPDSPWPSSSRASSPTPPSSSSPAPSPPASSSCNTGFVITSRPKPYTPPTHTRNSSPSPPSRPPPLARPSSSSPPPRRLPSPSPADGSRSASRHASASASLRSRRDSPPPLLSTSALAGVPASTPAAAAPATEAKTTLTLSSSIDAKGRRMVNQYVRLKTIGHGSYGKVWLCAEPTLRESDEDEEDLPENESEDAAAEDSGDLSRTPSAKSRRRTGKTKDPFDALLHEDAGDVVYCAIKSVARDGPGRGKSLRAAKNKKAAGGSGAGSSSSSAGISQDDKVKHEVAIMKRLDHPNVVRLKEVIDDVKSKKVFMVLEFMAGGQIVWQDENKQPTMTVDEARRTFRDVVLGLEYLHFQGIIHRDIKPANLLWTEDHSVVKISDFGVSHVSDALLRATPDGTLGEDDKALRKTAGSPAFFAPELCHPAEYNNLKTPTPRVSHPDADEYFSPIHSTATSKAGTPTFSSAPRRISQPLPSPDPTQPRKRPAIGKGIDVWALGVTLYCLLFGDTPFMAKTEYELYNMIVKESVVIPPRMGKEGAWTGVGPGWEGCGDGVEGREAVDLLAGLLQKDPTKRIGLDQVKKHPWVLRNLTSPDSWLHETDPLQSDTVIVTEEDLQQATQQRGAVDVVPQIRNRPGLRRALNAALVRFPAFSRMKSSHRKGPSRSRSKSASSTSQSVVDGSSEAAWSDRLSRNPSDAASRKKTSAEFGMDIRRIISAGRDPSPQRSAVPSPSVTPAIGGSRGGWGARMATHQHQAQQQHQPQHRSEPGSPALPGLSRSVSASSIGASGNGASANGRRRHHLFPSRKSSDRDSRASSISARGESPVPPSDVESTGRRKITQIISRLGGGSSGRATPRASRDRHGSLSDDDSLSFVDSPPTDNPAPIRGLTGPDPNSARTTRSTFDILQGGEDDDDFLETSDYSSDEDDEDELLEPPLARADGISGWQSTFQPYDGAVSVRGGGLLGHDELLEDDEERKPPSLFAVDSNSTPRASAHLALTARGLDPDPSATPPALVRQSSEAASRPIRPGAGLREGSFRNDSLDTPPGRKWQVYDDGSSHDEEDEGQEIFLAAPPRRKRAATSSSEIAATS